jgi:hypothetical protein
MPGLMGPAGRLASLSRRIGPLTRTDPGNVVGYFRFFAFLAVVFFFAVLRAAGFFAAIERFLVALRAFFAIVLSS